MILPQEVSSSSNARPTKWWISDDEMKVEPCASEDGYWIVKWTQIQGTKWLTSRVQTQHDESNRKIGRLKVGEQSIFQEFPTLDIKRFECVTTSYHVCKVLLSRDAWRQERARPECQYFLPHSAPHVTRASSFNLGVKSDKQNHFKPNTDIFK